ncbi:hypothetical protein PAESOLCIP111_05006 [Paenibacillus solanacearum]|uniref:Beta-mannanase n=1 Tax=Paenibacillus solanacearum TaxID=2048548 RepID=A0A916NL13_9BACL|nr:hypothetical protein [Paenibacillus solanacearum]CAG7645722.1 hypothetical protein PAESOLCIP111_05006 [Paenibacillus solanacearum]
MQWGDIQEPYRIRKLTFQLQDTDCLLTWQWPKGVDAVCIFGFNGDQTGPSPEVPEPERMKLFTREEYKAHSGYRVRLDRFGRWGYRVFPCVLLDGRRTALRQLDEDNLVFARAGRAKIRCAVRYGGRWFGKYKTVRMELYCEVPVPKEALCYVKKEGGYPVHKEDGIVYPFLHDFAAGRTVLPEAEIGRNSYIRLFLTDGRMYGDLYELITE